MKHNEMLEEAAKLVKPRGNVYGPIRENHEQIAKLATAMTGIVTASFTVRASGT